MPTYTASIEIAAPPADVFPWICDTNRVRRRMPSIEQMHFEQGDPGTAGSTFTQKIREGGRLVEYHGRVTTSEPPYRYAFELTNDEFRMTVAYTLEASPRGTRVDYHCELHPARFIAKLIGFLLGWLTVRTVQRQMESLKGLVEAPSAPTS